MHYLEAHPDACLEDLYAAFGTPQEAADSALLNTDSAQIKKQLKQASCSIFCLRSLSPPYHGRGLPVGRTRHQPLCQPAIYY